MEKRLDLTVNEVKFTSYTRAEKRDAINDVALLGYDSRRDFPLDDDMCGFAAQILMYNNGAYAEPPRSVYHKVIFILEDDTDRKAVYALTKTIYIPKDECLEFFYLDFKMSEVRFESDHTYRLVVQDCKEEVTLGEYAFHLFGVKEHGRPEGWYRVCEGGLRESTEDDLHKSLMVSDYSDCRICFDVHLNFGPNPPVVRPELEMRVYNNQDGGNWDSEFLEPRCLSTTDQHYRAECPLPSSSIFSKGVYYAELRCMGRPIGGFVFDTSISKTDCPWYGCGIDPLDEYTPEAARARAVRFLGSSPEEPEKSVEDVFKKLLDEWVEKERGKEGCTAETSGSEAETKESEAEEKEPETEESAEKKDEPVEDAENGYEAGSTQESGTPEPSFAESLAWLTGLQTVKEKLLDYQNIMCFNKLRCDSSLPMLTQPLHAMFLGSPGTGKTTVAKMVGRMLHDMGVLSRGHVVVRERATLTGTFYGSQEEKTLEALNEAKGGILLIDEAYQLHQPSDPRDPGKFIIETLLTALADDTDRDWMLILAGYPEPTEKMLTMNPGLKSRIPDNNIYRFEDFSGDELLEIARNYFARNKFCLTAEADEALETRLKADYAHRDKNFGNARHVVNLIQTEIMPAMARRVVAQQAAGEPNLTDILAADIPPFCPRVVPMASRIGFTPRIDSSAS